MGKRKIAKTRVPGKNAGFGVATDQSEMKNQPPAQQKRQKQVKFNFKCDSCDRNFTDQHKLEFHQRIRHKTIVEVEDFGFITLDREASIAATGAIPTNPNPTQCFNEYMDYEDFVSNVQIGEIPETPETPTKLTDSVLELIGNEEARGISKPEPRQTEKIKLPTPASPPSSSSDSEEETPPPATTTTVTASAEEESQEIEDQLKCPICERQLPSASAYKNHIEVHQGKRPFLCLVPDCQLGYPTEIDLFEHHSLRHSKEPVFICEVCHKGYRSRNYLRSHQNRLGSQCKPPSAASKRRYH